MRYLAHQFSRFFLTFAILIAMAGTGFAHRVAPPDVDDSLLAYVAAGGAFEDICSDAGEWDAGGGHCDACRLVHGAVLPPVAAQPPFDVGAIVLQVRHTVVLAPISHSANPACPVRAPPMV